MTCRVAPTNEKHKNDSIKSRVIIIMMKIFMITIFSYSQHGNTCLHEAAWRGYSRLVKLLSTKETVNTQNNGGFTPLHLSCQAGHNQSTRELLLADADPKLVNTYGDTPLHTAVRYGHAGVARILLSARAPGDVQNKVS